MKKTSKIFESSDFDPQDRDPSCWHPVSTTNFSEKKKKIFNARKQAIDIYLSESSNIEQIVLRTGVSKSELYRLLQRAFLVRPDGHPAGYLACIPGFRLKQYELSATHSAQKAGKMSQFLANNPEIQKELDEWALGKKKLGQSTLRGNYYKRLWLSVKNICIERGLDVDSEYPFTNVDGGREAIRNYVYSLRANEFVRNASVVHGKDSGRLASKNGNYAPAPTNIPYERVQLDGHRIDGIFTALVEGPDGNTVEMPLSRIWLLVLIDVGSRCVLGYHLSLSENYTSEDVLSCIGSSLEPWKPKDIPPQVKYQKNAGLPSGLIDCCKWRIFNTLQMDNALSHLSSWVQERIIHSGALEVVTNRPRSPRDDSIVERFMETFEEVSLHQWPNTTGSNPQDPRRTDPEKAAKHLHIGVEELQIAADLAITNYNATPHTSLNSRSPIEYLKYRIAKGMDLIRYAPTTTLDGLTLFDREVSVTIRANLKQGHKPYVKFLGVRYTDSWLMNKFELANCKARIRVNTRDIRSARIFLSSGEYLGEIFAEARWLEKAHSIAMRRAITKLVRQRKLSNDSHQPVSDYLDFLAIRAPTGRKALNAFIKNTESVTQETANNKTKQIRENTTTKEKRYKSKAKWIRLTETISR